MYDSFSKNQENVCSSNFFDWSLLLKKSSKYLFWCLKKKAADFPNGFLDHCGVWESFFVTL